MRGADWLRDKRTLIGSTITRCQYLLKLFNDVHSHSFLLESYHLLLVAKWHFDFSFYWVRRVSKKHASVVRTLKILVEANKNGGTVWLQLDSYTCGNTLPLNSRASTVLHSFFAVVFHWKIFCCVYSLFLILALQQEKHPAVSAVVAQCQHEAQGAERRKWQEQSTQLIGRIKWNEDPLGSLV